MPSLGTAALVPRQQGQSARWVMGLLLSIAPSSVRLGGGHLNWEGSCLPLWSLLGVERRTAASQ